jgi:signal transduction histidine kinase
LIVSSVLWTAGLLALMHLISMAVFHVVPSGLKGGSRGGTIAGFAAMALGVVGVMQGFASFRRLRGQLLAVRLGEGRRVEGRYPSEVQPLIDELNALLEHREKTVARAMATAGDLAHGLKTPLALLAQEAERAEAAGNAELAESIGQQVERMSRQVNYHLARARAAASGTSGGARCAVGPCVDGVVRAVSKVFAARALSISSNTDEGVTVRLQQEDLEEILGNLLENACKWATSKLAVRSVMDGSTVVLTVDDDGPGLDPEHRALALERGGRVDETAPGSGLGLAIVRDLVELYAGTIRLEDSHLGGLRVRVELPGIPSASLL